MDVKKQDEAIAEFVRDAARSIEGAKERVIEMEKSLRADLEVARSAHVDLADVTKATHVLVGVTVVHSVDDYNKYPRRVELQISGANTMQLGEIDIPTTEKSKKNGGSIRYRAITLLFREEG